MSTDPCTFENDAKMGRTHTRRAWYVFVLLFVGLLGFIVSLYIVDGSAPDDSAMLPHFSEGGGENNALAVFLQKIDNIEALPLVNPSQKWISFSDQPQEVLDKYLSDNSQILEALDELLNSSPDTWRYNMSPDMWHYNLQGTLYRAEINCWPMTNSFIHALVLYDIRLAMDLKREDYSAAIVSCQKMLEAANGIEGAEGLTSCWVISDAMRNLALDALTQFAVRQGSKGDILQRIKKNY